MLFNSTHFAIFFPLLLIAYFSLPHRLRWVLLLAASYYFYMCWRPEYALLLLGSTAVSWACGHWLGRTQDAQKRKGILLSGVAVLLGTLVYFKYWNFFADQLNAVFGLLQIPRALPNHSILLPVGISFFTFHTLSYLIDVYRGTTLPERHFGLYALYVSFFPQLVAGPISRAPKVLPQFRIPMAFDYDRIKSGLLLMAWGFFQKVVVADRLAVLVDAVYKNPTSFSGIALAAATVCFAFQVLCDFAGYTDIAIGTLQIMGFDFPPNFRRPYLAGSLSEFWKRWHISLSSWLSDYVYTPLTIAYRDWGMAAIVVASLFTFLLSGIWHGAGWTFIIWGVLHGIGLSVEGITRKARKRAGKRWPRLFALAGWAVTFAYVCFTQVFFRAASVGDGFYIASHLFVGGSLNDLLNLGGDKFELLIGCFGIAVVLCVHLIQEYGTPSGSGLRAWLATRPAWQRWGAYYAGASCIFLLGRFSQHQFIYFMF
ncbi:MAG: MBOAT family O-acyltransferase [Fibrobacteria bacterium]